MVWPAVIAAGAALAGNLMQGQMQKHENARARRLQEQSAITDRDLQREFAQHGISWKVEDAKRAGINPLAALGAPTTGYTPLGETFAPDDMSYIGRSGQDIGRAISSTQTKQQRQIFNIRRSQALAELEGQRLSNERQRKELEGPSLPSGFSEYDLISGQSEWIPTNVQRIEPAEITSSQKEGVTAGINPGESLYAIDGKIVRGMSEKATEAAENDWYLKGQYFANQVKRRVNAIKFLYGGPRNTPEKRAFVDYVRKQKPRNNPGKGMEWRYHIAGYWKRYPKKNRLFAHRRLKAYKQ